jgi:hypothetical protein
MYTPKLRTLKLRNCTQLSDAGICPALKGLPDLRALGISYTQITGKVLDSLAHGCPKLHTLFMNDLLLDSEETLIQFIQKGGHRLETLSISGIIVVTGKTVHAISNHCNALKRLNISWCGDQVLINQDEISWLEKCPKLHTLIATGLDTKPEFDAKLQDKYCTVQFVLDPITI